MANEAAPASGDWLHSPQGSLLAWLIPAASLFAGLFAPASARTFIWVIALLWMGTACILNARRCGRTHCRYTGPYFLLMIVPVLVLGIAGIDGIYPWLALLALIAFGSLLLWWSTERVWGRYL